MRMILKNIVSILHLYTKKITIASNNGRSLWYNNLDPLFEIVLNCNIREKKRFSIIGSVLNRVQYKCMKLMVIM